MSAAVPQTLPLDVALQQAVAYHQAGRFQKAEQLYRAILQAHPGQPSANHNLGVLAGQIGQHASGLPHLKAALEALPSREQYWHSYATALLASGQVQEALNILQTALQRGIDSTAIQHLREKAAAAVQNGLENGRGPSVAECSQLSALFSARRYVELESIARTLVERYPDSGFAWKALGLSLQMQAKDALPALREATVLLPEDAEAHCNLGNALREAKQLDAALASCHRAIEINPDFALAHNNLGNVFQDLGRFDDAVASYRRAVEIKPDYAEAYSNMADALRLLGQRENAVASCHRALEIKPDFAMAHNNLGNALKDLGQIEDAAASYRRAVEIKPDYAEAYFNLGIVMSTLGQLDNAVESYRRALEIKPDYAAAYSNLGGDYKDAARLDDAVACYRRALEIDPSDTKTHSNLVYALNFHPAYDEQGILAEAKQFASVHCPPSMQLARSHGSHSYNPSRRLRIGYVSPDFRNHCQSLFTIPLLSNHDHAQFEIYCYADLAHPDEISTRLATYADAWRSTHLINDDQLAEMIVNDGIDILIDLTMHMKKGRPMLFARKPAPVQIAWLAYPGTTGIPEIDYRLTDPWLDPPEHGDSRYTETSIRLSNTFWCYDPLIADLYPNPLPALTTGFITLGSLNNFCKVSDDTLHLWGQVMANLPSSRLLLLAAEGQHRQRVFNMLGQHGIVEKRIEFAEYQPRAQYLQTYHRIDIGLDTLPANGHTTSLDSYWMGVPVVTKVGNTVVGRAGWSQLNNLGLPELAAFDDRAFIETAVALGTDLTRLSYLRNTLRSKLEASPLMDGKRFAGEVEAAYRLTWQSACNRFAAC